MVVERESSGHELRERVAGGGEDGRMSSEPLSR